jgi:hypothetical protein
MLFSIKGLGHELDFNKYEKIKRTRPKLGTGQLLIRSSTDFVKKPCGTCEKYADSLC